MNKPCVYLCGPMTGYADWNFPAFRLAADYLREHGCSVISPADFGADPRHTWADCMRRDLPVMWSCGVVVTLPGWEASKGARLETLVAEALGIPVFDLASFVARIPGKTQPGKLINKIASLMKQLPALAETAITATPLPDSAAISVTSENEDGYALVPLEDESIAA